MSVIIPITVHELKALPYMSRHVVFPRQMPLARQALRFKPFAAVRFSSGSYVSSFPFNPLSRLRKAGNRFRIYAAAARHCPLALACWEVFFGSLEKCCRHERSEHHLFSITKRHKAKTGIDSQDLQHVRHRRRALGSQFELLLGPFRGLTLGRSCPTSGKLRE